MSKRVLVPVANGSEDIETACIVDVLRRARLDVTLASCDKDGALELTLARGMRIIADTHISALTDASFDAIVLPGGMPGAQHLRDCLPLQSLLYKQAERAAMIGAICAAPAVVLAPAGLLTGRRVTAHPSFHQHLSGAQLLNAPVVEDGHLITSQGPGTALTFALALVTQLCSSDVAAEIAAAMVMSNPA